ncbi:UNVERIFIED_CONTAM: hypothetical protein GTU68_027555 [Idotea baltica]|nr:hypothetical protein [Idotea baltica]
MKDKNFPQTAKKLYDEILPLYKEIHAYVRHQLLKIYPGRFKEDGPIPAHILGNVWGQQWSTITDLVKPFKNAPSGSITEKLESLSKAQKIDAKKMFKMADEFYISLGMPRMTETFWNKSVFEKPKNTVTDCHGTAFDMSDGKDFRIKMCTSFTHEDFKTIHHEMGHVQYYMAYAPLPYTYRASACDGFHEAIGDTIALSVNTPEHLHEVGLLDSIPNTEEFDINYLLQVALEKVVFLPYSFILDSWRWAVYNSSIGPDNYNKYWWKLRSQFQGLMPPVARKKEDCDPLAKYHVAIDSSYIKYFISFIVQFQFFETLCKESGNTRPLHRCDFYKKNVGPKLM